MSRVHDLVRDRLTELSGDSHTPEPVRVSVNVRLEGDTAEVLDRIAQRLDMSRTGCATSLLRAAIYEAAQHLLDPEEVTDIQVEHHLSVLEAA